MAVRRADAEIIRGFLDGEAGAAGQVDAWIREVLGNGRLGLGADADDVAQEVRRKLVVSLRADRFRGAASLRTYVWRAAQHAAIDQLRARRARPETLPLDGLEPADPEPSAEDRIAAAQRRELLATILGRLDDECRALLAAAVFENLPYAEIARKLGATEGAIKVRALRCREKAAALFKETVTSAGLDRRFR